ncbi:MAG: acetyl-CoA carboxylase biotin carboxylase subunit [Actinobacteria bacterium]|nr:MAG: acetyl-CoA carboxylase biotin carboxylase subunit [Actinomycetota bacterium]REK37547.1 MAG: acetyl-CoA carboxylase biotin carboxylase subunit [Actinomycetota bacterium]
MKSVLVANRGEIAVRVIRTIQEMGMRAIAIYSELDRDALHVKLADEAWNAGAAPASESYLNQSRILQIAHESGAEAVHPGYGFLSENAKFAQAVADAGLIWVGPPASAIEAMGDKITSRRNAEAFGVPTVPGITEPVTSVEEVRKLAAEFGYPVAIKAAHGGGGKGLRVVKDEAGVEDGFEGARREADAYFGNPEVYVEKYLEKPRHVEGQILFDTHGKGVFLGERDCSVQRRHQKLIEETPSPGMTEKQRKALGKAALAAGRSCEYVNAGTVEFLMDKNGDFYFLEMNTRLQVEHTVTEMVTGIDLVEWQLRIARGEELSIGEVQPRGHAIEFRINAEDPYNNYLPSPGQVVEWDEPSGPGVRVDSWIKPETAVSQYYDNLMAKLVVWGSDRTAAINRGKRALREFKVRGVATTIPAHLAVLDHPDFLAGEHHTKWMEETVEVPETDIGSVPALPEEEAQTRRDITVEVGGRRFSVAYWAPETTGAGTVKRRRPQLSENRSSGSADGVIAAPMQGTIVKVHVKAGASVKAGDAICVLEAMKMENEVTTPEGGEIVDLRVEPGDTVASGQVIAIVK